MSNDKQISSNRQGGAALITSLIFLLIMSLIAITSLNTSRLEQKMAANAQNTMRTFNAAESYVDKSVEDFSLFSTAVTSGNPATDADAYASGTEYQVDTAISMAVTREIDSSENYAGPLCGGMEFATGSGGGGSCFFLDATSTATLPANTNINSSLTQGLWRQGAKGG